MATDCMPQMIFEFYEKLKPRAVPQRNESRRAVVGTGRRHISCGLANLYVARRRLLSMA